MLLSRPHLWRRLRQCFAAFFLLFHTLICRRRVTAHHKIRLMKRGYETTDGHKSVSAYKSLLCKNAGIWKRSITYVRQKYKGRNCVCVCVCDFVCVFVSVSMCLSAFVCLCLCVFPRLLRILIRKVKILFFFITVTWGYEISYKIRGTPCNIMSIRSRLRTSQSLSSLVHTKSRLLEEVKSRTSIVKKYPAIR
jgi:hypothetical protein